ncbi:MAG: aminodeoxychorismate/anthranilate synthase component II [Proteobacteria bacterium]|nr:aminodeoxychorismate/anthranilate synthase component II [Pseudomonadota bacterium]
MFLLIDNYDSFTYNLFHLFAGAGAEVEVRRNDAITVDEVIAGDFDALILSPGPGRPEDAGICVELVQRLSGKTPILGICLGHQAIAEAFGGRIVRAEKLMHGKTSEIDHDGAGIFAELPSPFTATRYHSLVVEPESLPDELEITAKAGAKGESVIMALRHKTHPVWGLQFHPESIASEEGAALARNFTTEVAGYRA